MFKPEMLIGSSELARILSEKSFCRFESHSNLSTSNWKFSNPRSSSEIVKSQSWFEIECFLWKNLLRQNTCPSRTNSLSVRVVLVSNADNQNQFLLESFKKCVKREETKKKCPCATACPDRNGLGQDFEFGNQFTSLFTTANNGNRVKW